MDDDDFGDWLGSEEGDRWAEGFRRAGERFAYAMSRTVAATADVGIALTELRRIKENEGRELPSVSEDLVRKLLVRASAPQEPE